MAAHRRRAAIAGPGRRRPRGPPARADRAAAYGLRRSTSPPPSPRSSCAERPRPSSATSRPDVLHPRRPRAGHPAAGGHPPRRPAQCGGQRVGRRPRLRDRRRPDRVRPGRDHLRRRRPGPGPGGGRRGEPRRPRPRRRGDGRGRDQGRHLARSRSPSPTRPAAPARGRTFDVDDWTPPWSFVEELLRRDACVKVAPGIPHDLVPHGVEAEWVSDHGEVKEAALWSGRLTTTRRRATVIGDGGLATLTDEDDPGARRARRRRLPLRARRGGDPGGAGHGGRGRRRRRPGRRAHRVRDLRRVVPDAVRPRLPGPRASSPTARRRCGRPCASAASGG